jgi:Asp-tRNA(Asn)/Glu-tRNA(Gln) amidotransferase A subunit family amidase
MIRKLLKHRVVPFGRHANGRPIGMLVCGRPGSDCALARVACSLSSAPI